MSLGDITKTIAYGYDPLNHRARKQVYISSVMVSDEQYVYEGDQIIRVIDILNHSATQILTAGAQTLGQLSPTTGLAWYAADKLDSVRAVVELQSYGVGSVVASYDYDSYGNLTAGSDDPTLSVFHYAGYQLDAETGNYYAWNRYYDPLIGDWLSADPIGFDSGTYNLYEYVGNDPLNNTDPTGLQKGGVRSLPSRGVGQSWPSTNPATPSNPGSERTTRNPAGVGWPYGVPSWSGPAVPVIPPGMYDPIYVPVPSILGMIDDPVTAQQILKSEAEKIVKEREARWNADYERRRRAQLSEPRTREQLRAMAHELGASDDEVAWRSTDELFLYVLHLKTLADAESAAAPLPATDGAGAFKRPPTHPVNSVDGLPKEFDPAQGFTTFSDFKRAFGSAGPGQAWHHIVEQTINSGKFSADLLHNPANLLNLPHGAGSIHAKISGYYSSKPAELGGLTVRQWISQKSFSDQFEFGIKVIKQFGGTKYLPLHLQ
ncbi:MAG: RHS repeat-associated core domain-containing protein [Pirellulales bacterium]